MPWSRPAARMREFVLALRAIWSAGKAVTRSRSPASSTRTTLMTPFFSPAAHLFGPPPVFLAGVGERMTEVAGEVCDGFLVHPFTTRAYFDEVTRPALLRGRELAGISNLDGFIVAGPTFVVTGRDEQELARRSGGRRSRSRSTHPPPRTAACWSCTTAPDLGPELTKRSKEGRWSELADLIDDELLREFAVVGEPAAVGEAVAARWGDVYDRVSLYANYRIDHGVALEVGAAIRAVQSR